MLQRLSLVLLFSIAAVVAAALALGAYLNYGSVRAAYFGQIDSRLKAIGSGIVEDIETGISFGIPLAGQETLGPLLEREKSTDPVLAAIDVLGLDGTIVHSSDARRVGRNLPLVASDGLRLSLPISNDFGSEAGSLRMVADQSVLEENMEATASAVREAAILALVGALALALLAVLLLLVGARRNAREAELLAEGGEGHGEGWALSEIEARQAEILQRLDDLDARTA